MPRLPSSYQAVYRSYTDSVKVNGLSLLGEILYLRLLCLSDDHGRYHGTAHDVLGKALSKRWAAGQVDLRDVEAALQEIEEADLIFRYEFKGEALLQLQDYADPTTEDRRKKRFPGPETPGVTLSGTARPRTAPELSPPGGPKGTLTPTPTLTPPPDVRAREETIPEGAELPDATPLPDVLEQLRVGGALWPDWVWGILGAYQEHALDSGTRARPLRALSTAKALGDRIAAETDERGAQWALRETIGRDGLTLGGHLDLLEERRNRGKSHEEIQADREQRARQHTDEADLERIRKQHMEELDRKFGMIPPPTDDETQ